MNRILQIAHILIIALTCSILGFSQEPYTQLPDTFNRSNPSHFYAYIKQNIQDNNQSKLVIQLIEDGAKLAREKHNDTMLVMMDYFLADYFYYREEYPKAIDSYQYVLPKFEQLHDTLMIARTFNAMGLAYGYQSDENNQLENLLKANEILSKTPSKKRIIELERIIVKTNIINHYRKRGDHEKTINLASTVLDKAREIGDSTRLASLLNTVALSYKNLGQTDNALEMFNEAGKIFDKQNNTFHKAFTYINIGGLYDYIHKNDSTLKYYTLALNTFKEVGYAYGELTALTGIAEVYAITNQRNEASKIFISSIERAKELGFSDIVIDSYADLADIEYKNKNFQKAYEYQQKHYELRDSVSSFEKEKKLAELQTQYETVQKENEINLLKSEKLIRENELRRNKLFSWTAFVVIFFLLVFIYVGFIFLNQNKKANELLTEKNNQIEAKNRQLSELNLQVMEINKNLKKSETALTLANNTKNRFFSILGHDLRNPFHSIMGQSYLLSKSYDQLSVEERKKYAQDIYQSCEKVNRLLDNLLEWIRTQSEGIVFNPQLTDFQQLVQESIAVLKSNADEKSINIVNKINHKIQITADYTMLETIVRNLIANGIKFTPPGGEVIISAQIQNLHLIVGISDNGVGIAPENMDKLFLVDSNFKTNGTNNERGTGLGLAICKELVSIHHGEIWAESVPGKGSVFHFSIPAPLTR